MNNILLENYIKSIIEENQINELHVFDFDMTLYDHDKKDWIQKIINNLKISLNNPKVRVVLCTARTRDNKTIIKTEFLLNKNNMSLVDFDECYFKSAFRKQKVPEYKSEVILDEVSSNNNILKVKFWDDRQDTLEKVEKDLKSFNKKIIYKAIKC